MSRLEGCLEAGPRSRVASRSSRAAAAIIGCLVLAGCAAFVPSEPDPGVEVPAAWSEAAQVAGVNGIEWPASPWWEVFESGELNHLIARAEQGNPDLAIAWERLVQAETRARIAGASLLPELSLDADAGRSGTLGAGAASRFSLGLAASYEVDLWGRNRADRSAARALAAASVHDRETVALTLAASVADVYLQVLALRERLAVARLNLAAAEDVLRLVEARERFGSASPLELAQQRAAVAGQRATIPALEQQEREARAALALLVGEHPQGFDVGAAGVRALELPTVRPGLPAEVLRRRPDIRQAEMALVAAEADIVVARAALFPTVRLTGSLGMRSNALSTLLNGDPLWSVASALTMPIFNAGRLASGRELAESRRRELLQSYRGAILAALADVDTVLSDLDALASQARWQGEATRQAERALALAETRYREGVADLLTVLDAQRTLYQARDADVRLRADRLRGLVALFRALGGSWEPETERAPADVAAADGRG